jgi:hypothetical protein
MAVRLRLALLFVVVSRWFKDLFVAFISFSAICVDDY